MDDDLEDGYTEGPVEIPFRINTRYDVGDGGRGFEDGGDGDESGLDEC